MMLKRFQNVFGRYVADIPGQRRLAYSMSSTDDFYDLIERNRRERHPGAVIRFHDLTNGRVYEPFALRENVLYGEPVFADGAYCFLRCDYDAGTVDLLRFLPERTPERLVSLRFADADPCANLRVVGKGAHVVSQGDELRCYYPEAFSFPLRPHEAVCLIEDDRVLTEMWVEEGWDDENERATADYRFYYKLLTRDLRGNVLSETIGTVYQSPDGDWWIA